MSALFESGVFGREPAWHGSGIVMPERTFDWETVKRHAPLVAAHVESSPVYVAHGGQVSLEADTPQGTYILEVTASDMIVRPVTHAQEWAANRRELDGAIVGINSSGYQLVTGEQGFQFLSAVCNETDLHVHTAGTLNRGRMIWVQCFAPEPYFVGGEKTEALARYLSFVNSFDGSTPIGCTMGDVRIVCANTFNANVGTAAASYWFKHTANVMDRVSEARIALGYARDYWAEIERLAEISIVTPFSDKQFADVRDLILPIVDANGQEISGRKRTNADNERAAFDALRDTADMSNIRNTAWGAVNMVTAFSDHIVKSRNTDANTAAANRLRRVWFDPSIKDAGIAAIYEMAGIK